MKYCYLLLSLFFSLFTYAGLVYEFNNSLLREKLHLYLAQNYEKIDPAPWLSELGTLVNTLSRLEDTEPSIQHIQILDLWMDDQPHLLCYCLKSSRILTQQNSDSIATLFVESIESYSICSEAIYSLNKSEHCWPVILRFIHTFPLLPFTTWNANSHEIINDQIKEILLSASNIYNNFISLWSEEFIQQLDSIENINNQYDYLLAQLEQEPTEEAYSIESQYALYKLIIMKHEEETIKPWTSYMTETKDNKSTKLLKYCIPLLFFNEL
ncbi:hypothetical protein CI610_02136 [invertebrate metagenome]|uniref:Uncharacterized protein n=1 Tax=invertebrate metagenome TaxID=1711999 RepID=A0A2H9T6T5_9ZZZZ